jgi:hypothetical protein
MDERLLSVLKTNGLGDAADTLLHQGIYSEYKREKRKKDKGKKKETFARGSF